MAPGLRPPKLRIHLLDLLQLRIDRRRLGRKRKKRRVLCLQRRVDALSPRKRTTEGRMEGRRRTVRRVLRLAC